MAHPSLRTRLGATDLRSPLIAASGTVGSVREWARVADVSVYGGAVAKSVSGEAWPGRPSPRLAPTSAGMLNGIGIQNPGIDAWVEEMGPYIAEAGVPIWGSAVGRSADEFAHVAKRMSDTHVAVIEVNLSCPNLEDGEMFSFNAVRSAAVLGAVADVSAVPIGAKLSPDTPDLLGVAEACLSAGAAFLTLTNTARGFGVNTNGMRPALSGGVGGYSGPGLKPIAMRCVYEVAKAFPSAPIVGCGGAQTGRDVAEYMAAGASAVAIGTAHFAEPKAGERIVRELKSIMPSLGVDQVSQLVGRVLS